MGIFDEPMRSCGDSIVEEMRSTVKLLRGVIQMKNKMEAHEVSSQDLDDIKDIYKTFYYIDNISKGLDAK